MRIKKKVFVVLVSTIFISALAVSVLSGIAKQIAAIILMVSLSIYCGLPDLFLEPEPY